MQKPYEEHENPAALQKHSLGVQLPGEAPRSAAVSIGSFGSQRLPGSAEGIAVVLPSIQDGTSNNENQKLLACFPSLPEEAVADFDGHIEPVRSKPRGCE